GFQRERERPLRGLGPEGLHRQRARVRAVWHRLDGDRAVDLFPDPGYQWQHRLRPAVAVEAHDLRSLGGEDPACLHVAVAVTRLIWLRWRQRDHRWQP